MSVSSSHGLLGGSSRARGLEDRCHVDPMAQDNGKRNAAELMQGGDDIVLARPSSRNDDLLEQDVREGNAAAAMQTGGNAALTQSFSSSHNGAMVHDAGERDLAAAAEAGDDVVVAQPFSSSHDDLMAQNYGGDDAGQVPSRKSAEMLPPSCSRQGDAVPAKDEVTDAVTTVQVIDPIMSSSGLVDSPKLSSNDERKSSDIIQAAMPATKPPQSSDSHQIAEVQDQETPGAQTGTLQVEQEGGSAITPGTSSYSSGLAVGDHGDADVLRVGHGSLRVPSPSRRRPGNPIPSEEYVKSASQTLHSNDTVIVSPPGLLSVKQPNKLRKRPSKVASLSESRDSGLTPTTSSGTGGGSSIAAIDDKCPQSPVDVRRPSSSATTVRSERSTASRWRFGRKRDISKGLVENNDNDLNTDQPQRTGAEEPKGTSNGRPFTPLTTDVPNNDSSLGLDQLSFSKRGSVLVGGRKAMAGGQFAKRKVASHNKTSNRLPDIVVDKAESSDITSNSIPSPLTIPLTEEEIQESLEIQALYRHGDELDLENQPSTLSEHEHEIATDEETMGQNIGRPSSSYTPLDGEEPSNQLQNSLDSSWEPSSAPSIPSVLQMPSNSLVENRNGIPIGLSISKPNPFEEAATIVAPGSIDRHGFIRPELPAPSKAYETNGSNFLKPQDTGSTAVMSSSASGRSLGISSGPNPRPLPALGSIRDAGGLRRSASNAVRAAVRRLPGNGIERMVNAAPDAVYFSPEYQSLPPVTKSGKAPDRNRDGRRIKKWEEMAVRFDGTCPGEKVYLFPKSGKLTSRTWKGIPDRWRSSAWASFLDYSYAHTPEGSPGSETEQSLIEAFERHREEPCKDDLQIHKDVERTFKDHIVFSKNRNRGQRDLFQVLRALSLHYPETGYVQGMASIVATLLLYYLPDKAFVMACRMWALRGLSKLFSPEFHDLFVVLADFDKHWLHDKGVKGALARHNIEPMTYGTRWYLTLFNYSVPFEVQLRIWDIFMLMGGEHQGLERPFMGSFDPLHACGAALLDSLKDVLIGGDFEVAMKTLTGFVDVQDPDLFMKVAKAEFRRSRTRLEKK